MTAHSTLLEEWTTSQDLIHWVRSIEKLCRPKSVHLVDGSDSEYALLLQNLESTGTIVRLNPKIRPNSYLARSNPEDVARVEDRTFICSVSQSDAGPTNNWKDPVEMQETLLKLFRGCMEGRTMYVVPYCMGPEDSAMSRIGVQITDSAYVVANMHIMTRIGSKVLDELPKKGFVKCLHSVGAPLGEGVRDCPWPCNPSNTCICHFPETKEIWSFGSGYGGNALLNKKCFALRIATKLGYEEGWLAEHMLIVGITTPEGKKHYIAASFPSACGKTNLAMLRSNLPGWKVECIGDDIAWMHFREDGRLWAINPEYGFFGVAPGTSEKTNPNAMKTIEKNTIFTNVALTDNGDVWWEGMTSTPPEHAISWLYRDWTPEQKTLAAHPNARFTAPVSQCPMLDSQWESPEGVPISAIIFGGRRSTTVPLVRQALSWSHGVFLGASMSSETTAASKGEVGKLRHDPFAMLPFCGYNMADYFQHWLNQEKPGRTLPQIFYVNWFLKSNNQFIWPGFQENMRVVKWIIERVENKIDAEKTPIGYIPKKDSLDLAGLDLSQKTLELLFRIDQKEWNKEAQELAEYFSIFGDRFPKGLKEHVENLHRAYVSIGES